MHGQVIGKTADHQQFFVLSQIGLQRGNEGFQYFHTVCLQLIRVQLEQHVATDANAAILKGYQAFGQWIFQRLLQCNTALLLGFPLGFLFLQRLAELYLNADHPHQYQHQNTHQRRHQV